MNSKDKFLRLSEVLFLCLLVLSGLVIRLINIRQPFVEMTWSWRQSDVAMIAENFFRHGFNIFYPQINWVGHHPGYVGTEFPLVPFIASAMYVFLGVHDWIGRFVSVVFFLISVPFFYLLVRKISNDRGAALASGIYTLAPLSVYPAVPLCQIWPPFVFQSLPFFSFWHGLNKNLALACL
jgi:4-amino-4-deoxy-L-arabinose transferase-like glycosyltransferase